MKKQFIPKLLSLFLFAAVAMVPLLPTPVSAACGGGGAEFTLLPAWYDGLDCNSNGSIIIPSGGDGIRTFIFTVIGNLVEALFYIVGYVSLGMLIWGGFKYMLYGNDSSGMQGAKKTIQNALIGLVISIFAVVIVNLIAGAF